MYHLVHITSHNLPYEKVGNEIHCLSELVPFEIPDTWEWCKVGDLFYNASGLSYKKDLLDQKNDSMVRVLRGGNIENETYFFKEDDVFIASEYVKPELYLKKNYMITPSVSSIEHIGKIALIKKDYTDVVVGGFVLMLIPYFCDEIISQYLLYAFATKNHRDNCRNITHKSGQAFYNLSREKMMNLPVPLPPHNEMLRIIRKLNSILPTIAEYGIKAQEVYNLNTIFPNLLKKSILQEAVQGTLIPQNPSDEPASILLERIRAEKERLIQEGKIKRDKHESVIYRRDNSHYEKRGPEDVCIDEEIPFEVPSSWALIRLNDIGIYKKGPFGSNLTKSMFVPKGIDTVKVYEQKNAIQKDHTLGTYYITRQYYESKMKSFTVEPGDILVSCAGTIGETYILPKHIEIGIINQALMRMTIYAPIDLDYFLLYFDYVLKQIAKESSKGSAIKNIPPFEIFKKLILPLPPLEEQKRIVAKVRELENLCNLLCS